jgi:hypothetical protein
MLPRSDVEVETKLGFLGHSLLLELGPRDTIHPELMRKVALHDSNPNLGT